MSARARGPWWGRFWFRCLLIGLAVVFAAIAGLAGNVATGTLSDDWAGRNRALLWTVTVLLILAAAVVSVIAEVTERQRGAAAVATAAEAVWEPLVQELPDGAADRPTALLLAEHRVVPARGRRREMGAVQEWLAGPGPQLLVVTGEVGVGKTRLAVEVAAAPPAGWQVGRLRPGRESGAVAVLRELHGPLLVVVEAGAHVAAEFLADVAALPRQMPLRVMLLTRTEAWVAAVRAELPEVAVGLLDQRQDLHLQATGGHEDLVRWYGEAVAAFTAARQQEAVDPGPTRDLPAMQTTGELHARALVRVLSMQQAVGASAAEVGAVLAEHERRQWPPPEAARVDQAARDRCVAVLTLLGAAAPPDGHADDHPGGPPDDQGAVMVDAESAAAAALEAVPDLADDLRTRRELARWVHDFYPGTGGEWIAVPAPQLLTRHLILDPLVRSPSLWRAVISRITPERLPRILGILAAAAAADPEFAGRLLSDLVKQGGGTVWLDSVLLADGPGQVDHLLEHLIRHRQLPEDTLDRLDADLDVHGFPHARLELARRQLSVARAASDPVDLPAALARLRDALARVGRYDEQLAAAEEAVELWRELATAAPVVHRPGLAGAVRCYADALDQVGRYDEGLAAAEESVGLWRDLDAAAPAVHRPDLAHAVGGYAVALERVGRHGELLVAAKESVGLWRELAAAAPAVHSPDLAVAVQRYAVALGCVGRYAEGLTAAEEALELWRELAAAAPTVHSAALARAVRNYAGALDDLGRHDEGLAADQRSVRLWRDLAAAAPAVHGPDLAHAIRNHAIALDRIGRHHDALAPAEESVGMWRPLAAAAPQLHRPGLANALHDYAAVLLQVGRQDQGLAAAEQSVGLWRELEAGAPAVHGPGLALALVTYGGGLDHLDRHHDALAAAEESVELWRKLAAAAPYLHRPGLARALYNNAVGLRKVGLHDDAVAAAAEAVRLFEKLTAAYAYHHADLAEANRLHRDLLRDAGRQDELITRSPGTSGSD